MFMPTSPMLMEAVKKQTPVDASRRENKFSQQAPMPNYSPMNRISAPTMMEPSPNVHPALLQAMRTMPMGPGY